MMLANNETPASATADVTAIILSVEPVRH